MLEDLQKQMEFVREADKMKGILRANMMLDMTRHEDDAQHSWHIALMALILSDYAAPGVDIDHAVRMLLVHDMVEIDAGDTYAYDEAALTDKDVREQKAADRIFGLLPEKQGKRMRALWEEFEACGTPTSQYANAIDRLQPLWGNFWIGGQVWQENRITMEKVLKRNEITKKALPQLWDEIEELLKQALERGYLR